MPRAKSRAVVRDLRYDLRRKKLATSRIVQHVYDNWPTTREAASALRVRHNTLWRSMTGNNVNGPSLAIVTALAEHSGKSTDYFLGRDA